MPLIIPHLTLGGPADEERQAHYFRRWWDVQLDSRANPCDNNELLLQTQVHRTEYLVPTYNFLSAIGLSKLVPNPSEERDRVRQANGDEDTNPYRIVVKSKPYYFAIATAKTEKEILEDWESLNHSLLTDIRRIPKNKAFLQMTPQEYSLHIVKRVIYKVTQVLSNDEERQKIWGNVEKILNAKTVPELSKNMAENFPQAEGATQHSKQAQAILRDVLLLRARMFRRDRGDDLELSGPQARLEAPPEPVSPVSPVEQEYVAVPMPTPTSFKDLIWSKQTLADLHELRDEVNSWIATRQRELEAAKAGPSTDAAPAPPPPPPPPVGGVPTVSTPTVRKAQPAPPQQNSDQRMLQELIARLARMRRDIEPEQT